MSIFALESFFFFKKKKKTLISSGYKEGGEGEGYVLKISKELFVAVENLLFKWSERGYWARASNRWR
jgi:hypothetical protein